jgi:hypothetical protein
MLNSRDGKALKELKKEFVNVAITNSHPHIKNTLEKIHCLSQLLEQTIDFFFENGSRKTEGKNHGRDDKISKNIGDLPLHCSAS